MFLLQFCCEHEQTKVASHMLTESQRHWPPKQDELTSKLNSSSTLWGCTGDPPQIPTGNKGHVTNALVHSSKCSHVRYRNEVVGFHGAADLLSNGCSQSWRRGWILGKLTDSSIFRLPIKELIFHSMNVSDLQPHEHHSTSSTCDYSTVWRTAACLVALQQTV